MASIAAKRLSEMLEPGPPPLGMTQADLARKLGVTPQAVSAWLHGKTIPTPQMLRQLEDVTGIPMREWTEEGPDVTKGAA